MLKAVRRPVLRRSSAIAALAIALVATALIAGCASTDTFERAKVLLDSPRMLMLVNTTGYADTVNFGGAKIEAKGESRITMAELDLFYDRNDNGRLDAAESIAHWVSDSRNKPSAVVLLLPGSGAGFKNTGIPVQRLVYQASVTFADGNSEVGTLRAHEK